MRLKILASSLVLVISSVDYKNNAKLKIFNLINLTERRIPILNGRENLQQTAKYFCESKNNEYLSKDYVPIITELCSYAIQIYFNLKQFLQTHTEKEKEIFQFFFENIQSRFPEFCDKINENWMNGKEHPILIEDFISIIETLNIIISTHSVAYIHPELNARIVKSMNIISDFFEIADEIKLLYINAIYMNEVYEMNTKENLLSLFNYFVTPFNYKIDLSRQSIICLLKIFDESFFDLKIEQTMSNLYYEGDGTFDGLKNRLKYLIRYNFIGDRLKTFLGENSIFNEYIINDDSNFLTLEKNIDDYLKMTKYDHNRIKSIVVKDINISYVFNSVYEDFLKELNEKLDTYEEYLVISINNIYDNIENKKFLIFLENIYDFKVQYVKESYEKRFDSFFNAYVYLYYLIDISPKLHLNGETLNQVKVKHEAIIKRMSLLGFFSSVKGKNSFNLFNYFDVYINHYLNKQTGLTYWINFVENVKINHSN